MSPSENRWLDDTTRAVAKTINFNTNDRKLLNDVANWIIGAGFKPGDDLNKIVRGAKEDLQDSPRHGSSNRQAGQIKLEPVSRSAGFIVYLVKDNGVVLGFLRKGKDTSTDTFPWQAFGASFRPGGPMVGKLLGSFFDEDGGQKAAVARLRKGSVMASKKLAHFRCRKEELGRLASNIGAGKGIVAAPKLDGLVREFETLQAKNKDFGATDTEPDTLFSQLMANAIDGKPFPSVRPESWQLFDDVDGWKAVANALTKKAKDIYDKLRKAPYVEVVELAKYHGWA